MHLTISVHIWPYLVISDQICISGRTCKYLGISVHIWPHLCISGHINIYQYLAISVHIWTYRPYLQFFWTFHIFSASIIPSHPNPRPILLRAPSPLVRVVFKNRNNFPLILFDLYPSLSVSILMAYIVSSMECTQVLSCRILSTPKSSCPWRGHDHGSRRS